MTAEDLSVLETVCRSSQVFFRTLKRLFLLPKQKKVFNPTRLSVAVWEIAKLGTVGLKSRVPCFDKKYMEVWGITFVAHYAERIAVTTR